MSCSSCGCDPCTSVTCDASNEPLASALNNFITAFFGSLTKTCVNNKVVWVLPCDLDSGISGYPRVAGEGIACYFFRVFEGVSAGALVKVSADDTTPGNLEDKIGAGTGIALTVLNPGGDETLEISNTGIVVEVDPDFNASEAALFVAGDKALLDSALQPEPSVSIAASNIDWSLSSTFFKTLGANTTFTFTNDPDGKAIVVAITNTAGNFTATWPVAVQWANGSEPVLTLGAKTDVFTFVKINNILYGSVVQNMT